MDGDQCAIELAGEQWPFPPRNLQIYHSEILDRFRDQNDPLTLQ